MIRFSSLKSLYFCIISLVFICNLQAQSHKASTKKPSIVLGKNTPLMGWASWNNFRAEISEPILKAQVDGMIKSGLPQAGYRYFNIDDGFFDGRDAQGNIIIDKKKVSKRNERHGRLYS